MAATPHAALIIDDDRDLLLLVRRTLEFTAGWQVRTASSGATGIELAKATPPDRFAELRAESVAGLGRRIETRRTVLAQLEQGFSAEDAEALSRAAHSLTGTAASFGADGLAHVTGDLEDLARGWLDRRTTLPERSEEHTSELQSRLHLVCRLLLEKKKIYNICN